MLSSFLAPSFAFYREILKREEDSDNADFSFSTAKSDFLYLTTIHQRDFVSFPISSVF
jgi:hypothetical protein